MRSVGVWPRPIFHKKTVSRRPRVHFTTRDCRGDKNENGYLILWKIVDGDLICRKKLEERLRSSSGCVLSTRMLSVSPLSDD
jgi:hypothetical protein